MSAQGKSGIAWTDQTWNPIRGCTPVSDGCRNCYASIMASRFSGVGQPYDGLAKDGKWTGKVALVDARILDPLRWTRPRRIFVNSMSDIFHESVPDAWIDRIFAVMKLSPHHTFQVLTKRADRMRQYMDIGTDNREEAIAEQVRDLSDGRYSGLTAELPLRNVWIGASCEDQRAADERIPLLLRTPAAVRWVSAEPLLGPIDLNRAAWGERGPRPALDIQARILDSRGRASSWREGFTPLRGIDWIVVGGESGPRARPCDISWIRSIVRQCREAGTACFVKQLGASRMEDGCRDRGHTVALDRVRDCKGGLPEEWPDGLRVRGFPELEW